MKIYLENKNNIANDLFGKVDITDNLLEAECLVTWNSVLPQQLTNIKLAKEHGKRSVIINHGIFGERDHNKKYIDHVTAVNGSEMLADKYLCYGEQGKEILLDGGVEDEKIAVVGYPCAWCHGYLYKSKDKGCWLPVYGGESIIDPETKEKFNFADEKHFIAKGSKGNTVLYMPNHSLHFHERTVDTFNQVKDMDSLHIKATSGWLNVKKEENPFYEIGLNKDRDRKITYANVDHAQNLELTRRLLVTSKVVVSDIPSTATLLAAMMGVHVIIPEYDWGVKDKDGNELNNWLESDIICPKDKVKETVEKVLNGKIDKTKEMEYVSEYYGGLSKGNPTENILKEINGK